MIGPERTSLFYHVGPPRQQKKRERDKHLYGVRPYHERAGEDLLMASKRTTIFLLERDVRLIRTLQGRYGLRSQSDVIRFALRTVGDLAAAPEHRGTLFRGKRPKPGEAASQQVEHIVKARDVSRQALELHQQVTTYLLKMKKR